MSSFRKFMEALSPRDRRAVMILELFLAGIIVWKGAWLPAEAYVEHAKEQYRTNKAAQAWWAEYQPASGTATPAAPDTRPLASILTETSQLQQIAITSLSPESDTRIRLSTAPVPYARAAQWLSNLENQHGAAIADLDLTKVSEGMVEVRVTVEKAAPK